MGYEVHRPEGTFYLFRIRGENATGLSAYSNEAGATTNAAPVPCVESPTILCLNHGRFRVEVVWRPPGGQLSPATAIPLDFAPESGLFYFSSPSNIETRHAATSMRKAAGANVSTLMYRNSILPA